MCFHALYLAAQSEEALIDSYDGLTDKESKQVILDTKAEALKYRKLRAKIGEMIGLETKTSLDKELEKGELLTLGEIMETLKSQ